MVKEQLNIMVIGSFSGNNFGDMLVLDTIINVLSKKTSNELHFFIPTSKPSIIRSLYHQSNIEPIDISLKSYVSYRFLSFNILNKLKNIDIIITTAGIYFENKLWDPRYSFVGSLLPLLYLSKVYKIKTIAIGVGIAPPKTFLGSFFINKSLTNHDVILTRDEDSYYYINKLKGSFSGKKSNDIAHLNEVVISSNNISNIIGLNLCTYISGEYTGEYEGYNKEEWFENVSKIIDGLISKGKEVIIYANTFSDYKLSKSFIEYTNFQVEIVKMYELTIEELYSEFSKLEIVIGSRMHFCIFASLNCLPLIALTYHPKVNSYMESIGLGEYVHKIEKFSHNNIITQVETLSNKRAYFAKHLQGKMVSKRNENINDIDDLIINFIDKQ